MNYLSVCSGVEAASQAWKNLGWTPVAFSEIEPFPCAVLASRFPGVPNLGDISKIHYNHETEELTNGTDVVVCHGGIDLIVGGTPCTSFSVAGNRLGLEGASGLAYHYARLIGEIRPRWFVWENVPGALSSVTYGNQRDFNFLLREFAVGGDSGLGVRWNCCWRVLDTQYVRVDPFPRAIPQRRRRLFVVGRIAECGGGGCEVLLEPEGLRGNPPPRRVKGKGFARSSSDCTERADGAEREIGSSLEECESGQSDACMAIAYDGYNQSAMEEVAFTQRSAAGGTEGNDADIKIAVGLPSGVECLTPSADHPQTHRVYGVNGAYPTISANSDNSGSDQSAVCLPVESNLSKLDKANGTSKLRFVVRRITPVEGERLQGFECNWTRPCFTPDQITDELVDRFCGLHQNWSVMNGKKSTKPKSREWVREWLEKISSAECPERPRYKAIGNSMSVNVMYWIGKRIAEEDERRAGS